MKKITSALLACLAPTIAFAEFTTNSPTGTPGSTVNYTVSFTGDGATVNAQLIGTISDPADRALVTIPATGTASNGAQCFYTAATGVFTVNSPDGGSTPFTGTTLYCTYAVQLSGAATIGTVIEVDETSTECSNAMGGSGACTGTNVVGDITAVSGPASGPAITYTPAPNAAVGTVTFPAATSIGGTTTFDITTVIGAGGANGGETVVGSCVGATNVTFTDGAETCTAGGACVDGNLSLQCAATNAAQTGTVSCTETTDAEVVSGDNATTQATRTWGFTCPAANVNPTLVASPGAFVQNTQSLATAPVTVTPSGGSGTGSATYGTCTFDAAGIAVGAATTGTPLNFSGTTTTPQQFNVTCDPQAGGTSPFVMTCSNNGTPENINLVCPQEVPRSAPAVTYGPTPTFTAANTVGAPATASGTLDIDLSGGLNDNAGGQESASVSCSLTTNPGSTFSLGSTTSVGPVVSPATTPTPDLALVINCATPANAAVAGQVTCNYTPTVDGTAGAAEPTVIDVTCPAAPVNVSPGTAEGTITLSGAPATQLPGSFQVNSLGSSSTLTCTVGGSVTAVSPLVQPIPAGPAGSVAFSFTCLAGGSGANNPGTISCTTGDTVNAADATLDYTVACIGLTNNPIPAINDLGKVLMAALMIGLGLLGLGLRRQSA